MTDQPELSVEGEMPYRVDIAVDAVGDPHLIINIVTPPGAMVPAEVAEGLALEIMAAAANSRMRAGLIRKQLLAGASVAEAVDTVQQLFDVQSE